MYKLLLAAPPACSSTPSGDLRRGRARRCRHVYPDLQPPWTTSPTTERATLVELGQGREMPYPIDPGAGAGPAPANLTADEQETVSFWIEQGAAIPSSGCAQ